MKTDATRRASLGGAVAAAVAASACCVGPLILAVLGIGGAGFLVALEPYRPIFTAITIALLGTGWYLTYRRPAGAGTAAVQAGSSGSRNSSPIGHADGDDCGCEMPAANKAGKRMLWVATAIAAGALAFPYLTPYIF